MIIKKHLVLETNRSPYTNASLLYINLIHNHLQIYLFFSIKKNGPKEWQPRFLPTMRDCSMTRTTTKISTSYERLLDDCALRATLINTSSKVVSTKPHAWMVNLLFANSTALKTSAILTSCFGISNFWVPDMWYTLFALGESRRTKFSTSSSWSEDDVIVNT